MACIQVRRNYVLLLSSLAFVVNLLSANFNLPSTLPPQFRRTVLNPTLPLRQYNATTPNIYRCGENNQSLSLPFRSQHQDRGANKDPNCHSSQHNVVCDFFILASPPFLTLHFAFCMLLLLLCHVVFGVFVTHTHTQECV